MFCFANFYRSFFKPADQNKLLLTFHLLRRIGLEQNLVLSELLQFFILSSYVLLAVQLIPDTSILLLCGAFCIVVLATTVSIGFGGYGARKATAGAVLLSFGLQTEASIAVGLKISVTHFLSLG